LWYKQERPEELASQLALIEKLGIMTPSQLQPLQRQQERIADLLKVLSLEKQRSQAFYDLSLRQKERKSGELPGVLTTSVDPQLQFLHQRCEAIASLLKTLCNGISLQGSSSQTMCPMSSRVYWYRHKSWRREPARSNKSIISN